MKDLESTLRQIEPADRNWAEEAEKRQRTLTKPPGSLGRLEEIANRICAMQRSLAPVIDPAEVLVFAADHGVCEEGVNPYPQSVTRQMLANFAAGGAAINAIATSVGAKLTVVDVGVKGKPLSDGAVITRRIAEGTYNFCKGPAMLPEQAVAAIWTGMRVAEDSLNSGANLLAIGEMGIGNTTSASAICAALTGAPPSEVCGRGTGADEAGIARKRDAVERALKLHGDALQSPFGVLSHLGGFEIAALCGVCIQAALRRVPVIVDGFISSAAASIAAAMNRNIADYLIAGHRSAEPGHSALLAFMGLEPLLSLGMALGEGTGAALAIPVVRAAVAAFCSMATFESAGVSDVSTPQLA